MHDPLEKSISVVSLRDRAIETTTRTHEISKLNFFSKQNGLFQFKVFVLN